MAKQDQRRHQDREQQIMMRQPQGGDRRRQRDRRAHRRQRHDSANRKHHAKRRKCDQNYHRRNRQPDPQRGRHAFAATKAEKHRANRADKRRHTCPRDNRNWKHRRPRHHHRATPPHFPPRRGKNPEKMEPINAATPVHATTAIGNPAACATTTGIAPFSTSPQNVIAAALPPPARATLDVPILPEPTARGSKPSIRPTITPVGIEPTIYAPNIRSASIIAFVANPQHYRWSGLAFRRRFTKKIGVTGFEPATPASRTQCSGQAEL